MEEVGTVALVINNLLKDEPALADRLPMGTDKDDLFDTCSDGLVLIYLLREIDPTLIDLKLVNKRKNLNIFQVRQNLDYALNQASKIIKVVGTDAQTFLDRVPHLMLGIFWQIVRYKRKHAIKQKLVRQDSKLA